MNVSDIRGGLAQSPEDIFIAALVMVPFTLTAVVLLGWIVPLPATVAIMLFLVLTVLAGLWNAGWRARTSMVGS